MAWNFKILMGLLALLGGLLLLLEGFGVMGISALGIFGKYLEIGAGVSIVLSTIHIIKG